MSLLVETLQQWLILFQAEIQVPRDSTHCLPSHRSPSHLTSHHCPLFSCHSDLLPVQESHQGLCCPGDSVPALPFLSLETLPPNLTANPSLQVFTQNSLFQWGLFKITTILTPRNPQPPYSIFSALFCFHFFSPQDSSKRWYNIAVSNIYNLLSVPPKTTEREQALWEHS